MGFTNNRKPLILQPEELHKLESISKSRTAPYSQVKRANILLRYSRKESINSIAKNERTSRPTVGRCIDKALSKGIMVALRDLPRPGRPPLIGNEDKIWVINLACSSPSDFGYGDERWTFSRLTSYIRRHCLDKGYPALKKVSKSVVHKILRAAEIESHKTRYFSEQRNAGSEAGPTRPSCKYTTPNQKICICCGQKKPQGFSTFHAELN